MTQEKAARMPPRKPTHKAAQQRLRSDEAKARDLAELLRMIRSISRAQGLTRSR